MNKEYNGWANYATWRINMEILGDIEFKERVFTDGLKEIVEDCVFRNPETCNTPYLVEDFARAFISQVDFHQIAQLINEELELQS